MKAYPEYKESGVEWLGDVPSHWELCRLGTHFFERSEKVNDTDYPPLSVTKAGIVPQLDNVAKTDANDNRKKVLEGDFVINSRSDRKGSSGVSSYEGSVSLISIVLEPKNYSSSYAHHLFRSYNFQEEFYRYGSGIVADLWSTRYADMKNISIPLMPLAEQENIAKYLDSETTRIDNLIAEKENFIKLLSEKRQALISNIVTKGLNPNAKMKDSGVEWIGEIPESWDVKRFRHLFSLGKGLTITKEHLRDRGIPCVNYGEIHSKYNFELDIERHPLKYVDEAYLDTDPSSLISAGDFVFADTSEDFDGCGNFTHLLNDAQVFAGYHTIIGRLERNHNSRYISYFLDSNEWRNQIRKMVKGVKVFSISQKILKDTVLFLPSEDEQNRAVEYLDRKIRLMKELEQETTDSIKLLQEHRVALISAAVTGKIDVREEV